MSDTSLSHIHTSAVDQAINQRCRYQQSDSDLYNCMRVCEEDTCVYSQPAPEMDNGKIDDVDEETSDKDDDEESPPEPKAPDGGYGWFVVLGCFLAHIVMGGIERSDGVFFLQFLERYDLSAQLTAWPGAIMSTMNLCIGPIASIVCNFYSVRASVMVAGLLMCAGCILDGFATNFYFLFFSHSFLLGLGRGLAYAPGLIIVAMYFDKRRGLATGLGSSGVGVGTFFLAPIAQYLFDNFGFQGTFLIFGGIALNINLAAMLYRPLSMNYRFSRVDTQQADNVRHVDYAQAIIQSDTISDVESLRSWSSTDNRRHSSREMQSLASLQIKHKEQRSAVKHVRTKENCLQSSLRICFPTEVRRQTDNTSRKLCHFYLLKNVPFLLYCLSVWLFTMATKSAFMFIPALVKFKGNTDYQASIVLSVAGAVDAAARIGSGFLLDTSKLRRYRPILYNLVMFAIAGVAFLLPLMDSFPSFLIMCSVYGLFTGTYISQKSIILVDILGIQHMANSLGILICFQSFGTLLGPPLSGALKDHFGTFTEAFYLGGGFIVVAAFMMLMSNVLMGIHRQKGTVHK